MEDIQLDGLGQHVLPANLEVLFNDCLAVDRPVLGSTLLCMFGPSILQGLEDPHIKWLELVSCFGGRQ